jgi:glycosyltransferase involved in cell wall biosynthesis
MSVLRRLVRRAPRPAGDRVVVHVTTTDMSLDWLLAPQLVAFADAGYEVVGMSAAGPHVERLDELGIRHVPIEHFTRSSNPVDDIRSFVELLRRFRSVRPDIVHTHNPKPGILGRIAARLTRTPLVVNTQHGMWAQPTDRRRRRWPVYAAERIAAAFGDAELVQNPEDVATLTDVLRVPAERVQLLGNGIDLARFDPAAVDPSIRTALRAEWGVGDDEIVCLVVGRLVREKGVVELLEAAEQLAGTVRFVIVGPSDDDKSDAIGDTDPSAAGVVFTGQRTDMPECYSVGDIFVTASWREGFPRSAMEAAAMGLPTVATDIRGNRQVIADGETGLLVPVRDADGIAAAIGTLAADPDRRAAMSVAARERAAAEFDQQRVIDRTLAAYARLD